MISQRLYALYQFVPFVKSLGFILSYLFCNKVRVFGYSIDVQDYATILNLLAVKRYSKVFSKEQIS